MKKIARQPGGAVRASDEVSLNLPQSGATVKRRGEKDPFIYDRRLFSGRSYWEKGFLSCIVAGADIPAVITPEYFWQPFNKVIFKALRAIGNCKPGGSTYKKYFMLKNYLHAAGLMAAAGGENYLRQIRDMVGAPSAVYDFAIGLVRLKTGVLI